MIPFVWYLSLAQEAFSKAKDVCAVAWQQLNKVSMTSVKRTVGTRMVLLHVSLYKYGKQSWWTVNGTRTIQRTLYQRFWFQRRRSGTAKSLICKLSHHQSFDPRCTLPRASRGSARHLYLVNNYPPKQKCLCFLLEMQLLI